MLALPPTAPKIPPAVAEPERVPVAELLLIVKVPAEYPYPTTPPARAEPAQTISPLKLQLSIVVPVSVPYA